MCQIQLKTGLGKSTIGRINREVDLNKENNRGGHPSKLSCHNKQIYYSSNYYWKA